MQINDVDYNDITFRHKGCDVKFQCITQPMSYCPRVDLEEMKSVDIAFKDMHEVDELIMMLQKFKEQAQMYMGVWRQ